jgi:hypothetical protein
VIGDDSVIAERRVIRIVTTGSHKSGATHAAILNCPECLPDALQSGSGKYLRRIIRGDQIPNGQKTETAENAVSYLPPV